MKTRLQVAAVAIAGITHASLAEAASFTIFNGQTVTTTQTLDTAGDVGKVKQGGTINAASGNAVEATADGVTVSNAGTVTGNNHGISVGSDNSITNAGTISAPNSGVSAENNTTISNSGVMVGGDRGISVSTNNTISNSGEISGDSYGILGDDGNIITNSGTIAAAGTGIGVGSRNTITNTGEAYGAAFGIFSQDSNIIANAGEVRSEGLGIYVYSNNIISNSGDVAAGLNGIDVRDNNIIDNSGSVWGSFVGIFAGGNGNTITNSRTVVGGNHGIYLGHNNAVENSGEVIGDQTGILAGSDNVVNNSGSVRGTLVSSLLPSLGVKAENHNTIFNSGVVAGGTYGISVVNSNFIVNSGSVIGGSFAVSLEGANNTLILLAGTNIQGGLSLEGTGGNRLVIGRGLNTALAFTGGTIVDNGLPFIVDAGVVYAVDITGFSVQDEMANDLTRAVAGAVDGRLSGLRASAGGLSTAMNGMVITATSADPASAGLWLSGLGAWRDQKEGDATLGFETLMGGAMLGLDGMMGVGTRAGLFAGWATADLETDADSQDLASDSFFGGLYGSHGMGQAFLDASVTVGWSDFDSDRHIANNQVPGGIETAEASYDGLIVSPSLKLGADMAAGSGTLTPSLRVRYAGLFLDGYDETGSSANLSVEDRDVSILDARAELAYGFAPHEGEGGRLLGTVRIGVDGTFTDGDGIDASLLGQTLSFNAEEKDTARGYAGFDVVYAMDNGAHFTLTTEAGYDTSEAFTAEAQAGLGWTF